ncbi:MAG TPA: UvrB/UvrC motif-containing protein [Urbifossiella sp.]|jgi:protein arginine kinase activator|nr:UvrB/UvrC motif-containing protein [Urbifossiella sp.]
MTCQFCDEPATVTLTEIVNKKKRVLRLCERCARRHNLIGGPALPAPQVDVKALLDLLAATAQGPPAPAADPAALTCPACGLQYGEFRATGRLGCPAEYDAFRPALEPLLARVHRADAHAGKAPGAVRAARRAAALDELRRRMAAAARAEDFEEAARLRDRIRQEEAADEPG